MLLRGIRLPFPPNGDIMTTRVLLVDDQALLRATFRLLIDSTSDLTVVGEAANGRDAVTLTRNERPDVVLMDIRMPDVDGIHATRDITTADDLRKVKIIMLTTFEADDLIVDALRAGASGYLGKGVEPAVLLDAIRSVAAGDSLLSPAATPSPDLSRPRPTPHRSGPHTRRAGRSHPPP
jgi:DNA-binding NarL/FixJ family response regulator